MWLSKREASARKRNAKWAVFLALYLLAGTFLFRHINVTNTPSLNTRVFFLRFDVDKARIAKGSYIVCRLPDAGFFRNPENLMVTKRVECADGQRLDTRGRDFFCEGRYLGRGKEHTLNGKKAEIFSFNGRVPEGAFFVMGDHPNSFDSRYFGFVWRKDVKAIAYPLF
jgi:type IV secretory pathway protease TraF